MGITLKIQFSSVWTAIPSRRLTNILIGKMKSTFYFILVCGIGVYVADGFLQAGAPSGFVPVWQQSQPSQNSVPVRDQSEPSLNWFNQPKCTQKIVDGETLLRVINAIIEDIPDICLSKFKMCGGFNEGNYDNKPKYGYDRVYDRGYPQQVSKDTIAITA